MPRASTSKPPVVLSTRPSPYENGAPFSISKTKAALRSATRLLAKDGLDASKRIETERMVEGLKSSLADAGVDLSAPKDTKGKSRATTDQQEQNGDGHEQQSRAKKAKKVKNSDLKVQKTIQKYKMLRHFEKVKTLRRLKAAKKGLKAAEDALEEEFRKPGEGEKKVRKKLAKEIESRKKEELEARLDGWYTETFPAHLKYVALYPQNNYVQHPSTYPSVLPTIPEGSTEPDYLSSIPSAKHPDQVRDYWRAVVKYRIEKGELKGEIADPRGKGKEKKKDKKAKMLADKQGQAGPGGDAGEAETSDEEDDSDEESEASQGGEGGHIDLDEGDDFFE